MGKTRSAPRQPRRFSTLRVRKFSRDLSHPRGFRKNEWICAGAHGLSEIPRGTTIETVNRSRLMENRVRQIENFDLIALLTDS